MRTNDSFARRIRLEHLYRHRGGGLLVVPLDHPMSTGVSICGNQLDRLVGELADNGADAIVLHKGALRDVRPHWFHDMSLFVHLSAGGGLSADPDAKYLVASVEEALRHGADAVSVHVNIGSATEARQVCDLARVADACDRWGLPLMAMVYARGPHIADGRTAALVAHATVVAAEMGADLVKTLLPNSANEIAAITLGCPIPVLAAGGAAGEGALTHMSTAMSAGAGGIAAGRAVFTSAEPGLMIRRLATLVHDRTAVPVS